MRISVTYLMNHKIRNFFVLSSLLLCLGAPSYAHMHSHGHSHGHSHSHSHFFHSSTGHLDDSPVHDKKAPVGAKARCKDGTYAFTQDDACKEHGGVANWLK
jgi:hypothetical protein